nr:hypothetical protein [Candidatus Sigynarchaeota archaeon]
MSESMIDVIVGTVLGSVLTEVLNLLHEKRSKHPFEIRWRSFRKIVRKDPEHKAIQFGFRDSTLIFIECDKKKYKEKINESSGSFKVLDPSEVKFDKIGVFTGASFDTFDRIVPFHIREFSE